MSVQTHKKNRHGISRTSLHFFLHTTLPTSNFKFLAMSIFASAYVNEPISRASFKAKTKTAAVLHQKNR